MFQKYIYNILIILGINLYVIFSLNSVLASRTWFWLGIGIGIGITLVLCFLLSKIEKGSFWSIPIAWLVSAIPTNIYYFSGITGVLSLFQITLSIWVPSFFVSVIFCIYRNSNRYLFFDIATIISLISYFVIALELCKTFESFLIATLLSLVIILAIQIIYMVGMKRIPFAMPIGWALCIIIPLLKYTWGGYEISVIESLRVGVNFSLPYLTITSAIQLICFFIFRNRQTYYSINSKNLFYFFVALGAYFLLIKNIFVEI